MKPSSTLFRFLTVGANRFIFPSGKINNPLFLSYPIRSFSTTIPLLGDVISSLNEFCAPKSVPHKNYPEISGLEIGKLYKKPAIHKDTGQLWLLKSFVYRNDIFKDRADFLVRSTQNPFGAVGEVFTAQCFEEYVKKNKLNKDIYIPKYRIIHTGYLNDGKRSLVLFTGSQLVSTQSAKISDRVEISNFHQKLLSNDNYQNFCSLFPLNVLFKSNDHPGPNFTNVAFLNPSGRLVLFDFDMSIYNLKKFKECGFIEEVDLMRGIEIKPDSPNYKKVSSDIMCVKSNTQFLELLQKITSSDERIFSHDVLLDSSMISKISYLGHVSLANIRDFNWDNVSAILYDKMGLISEEIVDEIAGAKGQEVYDRKEIENFKRNFDLTMSQYMTVFSQRIEEGKVFADMVKIMFPEQKGLLPSAILIKEEFAKKTPEQWKEMPSEEREKLLSSLLEKSGMEKLNRKFMQDEKEIERYRSRPIFDSMFFESQNGNSRL